MNELQPVEEQAKIRHKSRIGLIWSVPIFAGLVAVWLGITSFMNRGVEIEITFNSADSIEANKTKLKYKNVEIGIVKEVKLNQSTKKVDVIVEMKKEAKPYLKDQTRFWVVKARIAAKGVSGLDTLVSGAYIGIDPIENGIETRKFVGLESPPGVSRDASGKHYLLSSTSLGSLEEGAPVYFRKFHVGQIEHIKLEENGNRVLVQIFVFDPYDKWVTQKTKFWNSSGIDFAIDSQGVRVNTESITSIVLGGISFDTNFKENAEIANNFHEFKLHENFEKSKEIPLDTSSKYVMNFKNSIRGLEKGAIVEFQGIEIGKVEEVDISYDIEKNAFTNSVYIYLDIDRIKFMKSNIPIQNLFKNRKERVNFLINQGARAQLKSGNFLTGKLYIDIGFIKNSGKFKINNNTAIAEFPTVDSNLDKMADSVATTVLKTEQLMTQLNKLAEKINGTLVEDFSKTLQQANKTLSATENLMNENSPVQAELKDALREFAKTAKSLKALTDFLNRHPESIIKGKEE